MFKLSCPGKIFLAGEYLALKGGSSLVLCVEPRFELEVRATAELEVRSVTKLEFPSQIPGIPAGSPADRYVQKSREFFDKFELKFLDPYSGRGGFGASSAQFLLIYFLRTQVESLKQGVVPQISVSQLLDVYHNNSWGGQGWAPSGADVLAQYRGGLVFASKNKTILERWEWPFSDLDFVAFSTGTKIPTHEHLKTLNDFNEAPLSIILSRIEEGLREANRVHFLGGMRDWADQLVNHGWVHTQTLASLDILRKDPRVLAAKGCGALGADVILVFLESKERDGFLEDWQAGKFGVKIFNSFSRANISQGIQWKTL